MKKIWLRSAPFEVALGEGAAALEAQEATSALARAWWSGRGVEAAIAAAAAADAAKESEAARAERLRQANVAFLTPDQIYSLDISACQNFKTCGSSCSYKGS